MKKIIRPFAQDNPMWDIWMSMYHLPVVSVSDHLGLFSQICDKGLNAISLSKKLKVSIRSVEVLAEALISLGFLSKKNKIYSLNQTSRTYLLPKSPFYWGAILKSVQNKDEYKKILTAIESGSNQLKHNNKTFTEMWKEGSITTKAAANFTEKMHATIFAPAVSAIDSGLFKNTKNLLDAGGGSGCFSIAYLKKYPKCKSTIFELPVVCDVSKKYIDQYQLSDKISTHSGNFFNRKDWPIGHDGVLLSQILHDWPTKACEVILKNAYDSLPAGGKIYIHEMLLTENKSPSAIAFFDLLMLINHHSQQFTKKQIFNLLKKSGFKNCLVKNTFGYYSIIVGTK